MAQLGELETNQFYRMQLFSVSLSKRASRWYATLKPGQYRSWEKLERAFHTQFYNPVPSVRLTDLMDTKTTYDETAIQYIERISKMKGNCSTTIQDGELGNLVVRNMIPCLREALTPHDILDLSQ